MENKQIPKYIELRDDQPEGVVGRFTQGQTVYLKTGTMHCAKCGMKGINAFAYQGSDRRLALVRLPCGLEDYLPERAIRE